MKWIPIVGRRSDERHTVRGRPRRELCLVRVRLWSRTLCVSGASLYLAHGSDDLLFSSLKERVRIMRKLTVFISAVSLCVVSWWLVAEEAGKPVNRNALQKQFEAGNFKDAYEGSRKLALDPKTEAGRVSEDLTRAVQSLQQLGRNEEIDELIEASLKAHDQNWRLLRGAAQQYGKMIEHWGFFHLRI